MSRYLTVNKQSLGKSRPSFLVTSLAIAFARGADGLQAEALHFPPSLLLAVYLTSVAPRTEKTKKATVTCRCGMPVMPEITELTSRPSLFVANVTMTLIARGLDGKQSELGALRLDFPSGI